MGIIKGPLEKLIDSKGCVLTIGNFDGVHSGHQLIFKKLADEALNRGIPAIVLSFDPHPLKILQPDTKYRPLFLKSDLFEKASEFGIKHLVLEPFTLEFSQMGANDFLNNYILKYFNPKLVMLGEDFQFGREQEGTVFGIKNWCDNQKIDFHSVDIYKTNNKKVSTSLAKEFLAKGYPEKCAELLGRNFYLSGKVIRGLGKGKEIAVPTANITCNNFCPKLGVYFTNVKIKGTSYPSITNIGVKPSIEEADGEVSVESYLLNADIDLYGKNIKVELLKYLREEQKFSDLNELKITIKNDVKEAEKFFG